MANHASAKTRIRRNDRRAVINNNRRARMRTFIKRVVSAIEEGNADKASAALKDAQPEIHRSVAKGLLHKNTAARKLSRLSASIRKLKQA